jgi:two-component system, chemotaxis family, protein-glutamate methylesterase/glutaminase
MSSNHSKIRVLVVDDSAFLRRNVPRILETDPEIQVIGTAADGAEGVRLTKELRPDVIMLDVVMPGMDGLTALKQIMREAPTPVLMVSSTTREGTDESLEALALGAVDFIEKPSGPTSLDIDKVSDALISKVKAAYTGKIKVAATVDATRDRLRAIREQISGSTPPKPITQPLRSQADLRASKQLIAIAASTGGPAALQVLLPRLPAGLSAGIVIVQHIAPGFTRPLAERLNTASHINIKEAENGEPILPGVALLSPADRHLTVAREGETLVVRLSAEPANAIYRPSANVLFESIARTSAADTCAVVLTGMGDDGATGLRAIFDKGGHTIAQDEVTSLIYGMPKRAVEGGGVVTSLPLDRIAEEIVRVC